MGICPMCQFVSVTVHKSTVLVTEVHVTWLLESTLKQLVLTQRAALSLHGMTPSCCHEDTRNLQSNQFRVNAAGGLVNN